ncbi:unnamed protein product [Durusdinium trenchii]|uniref:Uncharacterized protein n=2 Tax=Durusdinium trenchii TaxID=1381693 RepID=A0ABP0Q367_9DINO
MAEAEAEVSNDVPSGLPDATKLGSAGQRILAIEDESEREEAISTVFKLIHNILGDLENSKKRKVKKANAAFQRKVGRHAAAVDFLRASGFLDADDAEAVLEEDRKGGLLHMPVAYILRLTDAHHVLAGVAKEANVLVPSMPGGSFNPCSSIVQSVDTTRSAKAPEAWKSQAESLRDEVKKRERELQDEVEQAPSVPLRPAAFWLSAGRRLEEVIREADQEEERTSDSHLLKEQVASAKQAISGSHTFESADKKRLAHLQRAKAYKSCVLRIVCPDKSVLQVHFRSADKGAQVLESIKPLLSDAVQASKWYVYRSPPLERMNPKTTLAAAGLAPGAVMYLGFDGEKCSPPFLSADLSEQLGPCPEESGVTAPASFTGEAMGWGAGHRLGEKSAPAKAPKLEGATSKLD